MSRASDCFFLRVALAREMPLGVQELRDRRVAERLESDGPTRLGNLSGR